MFNVKVLILVIFALIAICEAHKYKCVPVICPEWICHADLNVAENIRVYFNNETGPANGNCLRGEKYIFNGSNFADENGDLTGKFRCVCVDNETPAFPVSLPCPKQSSSSSSSHEKTSVTQCKDWIMKENETYGDFFQRIGATGEEFTADGCCKENLVKYILTPELSGYRKNICLCVNVVDFFTIAKK
jgi:hypothetical protein